MSHSKDLGLIGAAIPKKGGLTEMQYHGIRHES